MLEKIRNDKKNYIFLWFILFLPFSWVNTSLGSLYRLLTIVLFTTFLFYTSFKIAIPLNKRNYYRVWSLFIVYSSITTFLAGFSALQVNNSIGMLLLFLISIIFVNTIIEYESFDIMGNILIIIGFFFVVLFVTGGRTSIGWTTRQTLTIFGTMTDANEFASFFAISLGVAIAKMLTSKNMLVKLGCILLIISGLWIVLSTGSRGALIAVAASMIVTLFVKNKIGIRGLLFITVVFILLYYLFFNYIIDLIPQGTLSRLTLESIRNDSGSGRGAIWRGAIHDFFNGSILHIVFGYGYGGLIENNGFGSFTTTMHNQFLQVLVAYGFVGFSLYTALIVRAVVYYIKYLRDYLGCFIGMLVMGMSITMGPSYKLLWIMIMIPMITVVQSNNEVKKV